MKWPVLKCPICNATLDNREVRHGKPLVCPSCSASLQPSSRQGNIGGLAALAIAICICYLFGLRGLWLLVASVIIWFPVGVVWMFVFYRIVPPRFEPYRPPSPLPPLPTPPWKEEKFITLFPHEDVDAENPKQAGQSGDKPPTDS